MKIAAGIACTLVVCGCTAGAPSHSAGLSGAKPTAARQAEGSTCIVTDRRPDAVFRYEPDGDIQPDYPGQGGGDRNFNSEALVTGSNGRNYRVYAGGTATDARRGTIVVFREIHDACSPDGGFTADVQDRLARGAYRLAGVKGDTVVVVRAGTQRRFNFVLGHFVA